MLETVMSPRKRCQRKSASKQHCEALAESLIVYILVVGLVAHLAHDSCLNRSVLEQSVKRIVDYELDLGGTRRSGISNQNTQQVSDLLFTK